MTGLLLLLVVVVVVMVVCVYALYALVVVVVLEGTGACVLLVFRRWFVWSFVLFGSYMSMCIHPCICRCVCPNPDHQPHTHVKPNQKQTGAHADWSQVLAIAKGQK